MNKSLVSVLAGIALAGALSMGCSYDGVSGMGADKVVIARSGFFGLARRVYVCKVGEGGVTACADNDSP
jgi:hypothetical protein